MADTFFISDTHFGHENCAIKFRSGFSSFEEMDELIIANWNSVVKPADTVYHLGDFAWNNIKQYRDRLNGNINLVLGNHDDRKQCDGVFNVVKDVMRAKVCGRFIFLSHFSHRVWDKSHHNSWHLFGHSHGHLAPYGKSFDVGVDSWDYNPVSYDEVIAKMNTLPDNEGLKT
jgi:calcineurin-like phosphoesterase family protein